MIELFNKRCQLSFDRDGKRYELYFFGDDCFRFHVEKDPKLDVMDEVHSKKDAQFVKEGNKLILVRGKTKVVVGEDGLLSVFYKETKVLEELPYAEDGFESGIRLKSSSPVYGLGDKAGPINRKGYSYVNWNTDDPAPDTDTTKSLYKSIPFFVLFSKEKSVGIYVNNTSKTFFDFNQRNEEEVRVDISFGGLDIFVFVGSFQKVVERYSLTVGVGLMPRWVFGAQQSRWSYATREEAQRVIDGYKEADIPLSALYLDIDYMDRYMDFTINEERFPDMRGFLEENKRNGVRIVPIIDAGVKVLEGYSFYEDLMRIDGVSKQYGEAYHNDVWPGECVFPAFTLERTQDLWAKQVRKMVEMGFAGIWIDMNEPASFKGEIPPDVDMGGYPHAVVHNVYAYLMAKSTAFGYQKDQRKFIMTRAAFAGSEKYCACWTGDNHSTYDHVGVCLRQLPSMGVSGYSLVGVDLGGFCGDCTGELLVRFAQANLLTPIFRDHSACGTISQEPYVFGEDTLKRYRDLVFTRLELVPYMASIMKEHYLKGSPMIRPLVYNFPNDKEVENENTEMMFGGSLLIIPALHAGQRKREAYFPATFYNYKTGKKYSKGYHLIDCGLDDLPLFVKEKSIIPLAPKGYRETSIPDEIRLLYTGGNVSLNFYEDEEDADGFVLDERQYRILVKKGRKPEIKLVSGNAKPNRTFVLTKFGQ